jgi:hypothetical protein
MELRDMMDLELDAGTIEKIEQGLKLQERAFEEFEIERVNQER